MDWIVYEPGSGLVFIKDDALIITYEKKYRNMYVV